MWHAKCPYCRNATPGRSATTPRGRSVTECCACGRAVAERHLHTHHLFLRRAFDEPLALVTPDLPQIPIPPPPPQSSAALPPSSDASAEEEDPFLPTGFITAFSTWSLERTPVLLRGAASFSGYLAELERALDYSSDKDHKDRDRDKDGGGPMVSIDHLRAYLQILEVSSILGLDHDIADHAFQLFRDCCSATCMRNRSVEALATAALVHAIREAQEPRTLQEISTASNLPQKEIGKYIKILGESLQLSQPINSNSIAVHMPRFCSLLQLNRSAQELAAHIGEVVVNKCFCTRRNPISISAAAIYLACQLEDKRKTQAEICKVTGLTEVTLRKVYKELLENWDDLLPPNYTPAVPPEKAFPMTIISTVRSTATKVDALDPYHLSARQDKDKHTETVKLNRTSEAQETSNMVTVKEEADKKGMSSNHSLNSTDTRELNKAVFWQPHVMLGKPISKMGEENKPEGDKCINLNEMTSSLSDFEQKVATDLRGLNNSSWFDPSSASMSSKRNPNLRQSTAPSGETRFPGVGSKNAGDDHGKGK